MLSVYHHHGGLQLSLPDLVEGQPFDQTRYPPLFRIFLASLLKIFNAEQVRRQEGGAEEVPKLINEFIRYAYNRDPFRGQSWRRDSKPLKWWTEVSKDSNAHFLGVSVVHVYLARVAPSLRLLPIANCCQNFFNQSIGNLR